jgi:hypothetical protein
MILTGWTGKARCGKDTAVNYLRDRYGVMPAAFAYPLKSMLHVGLGLDPAKFQTTAEKEAIIPEYGVSYRHLAQTLGTDWGRQMVNERVWLIPQETKIRRAIRDNISVAYNDMRFENEAAMIRAHGGVVIHVMSLRESGLSDKAKAHVSESGVKFGDHDRVLQNNGTLEEFYKQVDNLWQSLVNMPAHAEVPAHG